MQVNKIKVDSNLKEVIKHGSSDLPITLYNDDFSLFDEGYIRWHWHKELQISYVLSDKVCFQVEGKEIILEPEEGIIFNTNVLHQIKPYFDNCNMYSFVFDSNFIDGNEDSLINKKYISSILNSNNLKYIVLKKEVNWQKKILEYTKKAFNAFNSKEYAYELEVRNYLSYIWIILLREVKDYNECNNRLSQYDEDRVRQALEYIQDNYSEDISLEDIAMSINISKSECCRSFKRVLNSTPFEYLMEYRILKSTQYLCNSNESISNIALNVGFNGISYYGKVFKRYMNCTPSQYRRKHNI